jgi:hypothetical protein
MLPSLCGLLEDEGTVRKSTRPYVPLVLPASAISEGEGRLEWGLVDQTGCTVNITGILRSAAV